MEINLSGMKSIVGAPPYFISIALIEEIIIEKDEVLLKVCLQPTGEKPMVRMSWSFCGNGFGLYILPEVGDEIVCVFPNGDLNRGICISRLTNGVDKIPSDVIAEQILLITKSGYNIKITIQDGDVNLIINGDVTASIQGNVNLDIAGNTIITTASMAINTGV